MLSFRIAFSLLFGAFFLLSPNGGASAQNVVTSSLSSESLAAPLVAPVGKTWSGTFALLGQWPEARVMAARDPIMARMLALNAFSEKTRELAFGSLSEHLPATLSPSIADFVNGGQKREKFLSLLKSAYQEAEPQVRARVESRMALVSELAQQGVGLNAGSMQELAGQLRALSWLYEGPIREDYKRIRRMATERAMLDAVDGASHFIRNEDLDDASIMSNNPALVAGNFRSRRAARLRLLPAPKEKDSDQRSMGAPRARQSLQNDPFFDPAHWSLGDIGDPGYPRLLSVAARLLQSNSGMAWPGKGTAYQGQHALLRILQDKDPKITSHGMRVGLMAGLIALKMGFPMNFAQKVRWAGEGHDIAKQTEPILSLVNQPRALTSEEKEIVNTHTTVGAEIIANAAGLDAKSRRVGREAALSHHENWGGGGYPQGLRGSDIPLIARIIRVADSYDAAIASRPEHLPRTRDEAVERISRWKQDYDPLIWNALLDLVRDRNVPELSGIGHVAKGRVKTFRAAAGRMGP